MRPAGPRPRGIRPGTIGYWVALVILAAVEVAWLGWALREPLPNAKPPGEPPVRRSYLLWRSLPEVVPGVPWRESFLGLAAGELSHVENLPRRTPIVLGAGLLLASGLGLGGLILRVVGLHRRWSPLERLAVGYGLGLSGLGLFALGSGRLGWLHPWTARLGLLAPIVAGLALFVRDRARRGAERLDQPPTRAAPPPCPPPQGGRGSYKPSPLVGEGRVGGGPQSASPQSIAALLLVVGPFLLLMALGSMLPAIDFDAIEYHLQGPKEYYQAGRIAFLPHNVYTSMPFGVEMLHLLGMELMDDWWWGALVGQLVVASFAPMTGLAIWLTARRWGSPRAAWVATAVYLTTPWVYRLAAIPYVEGPLCYYHAALAWAAGMAWGADPEVRGRSWLVVGLLAGGAMAIKYPALISAVVPFGAAALASAWKGSSPRGLLAFGVGVAVVIGPWMAKNVADTGNPVYPLGYRVFGGRDWDEAREAKWANAHGPRPVGAKAFLESIVDVAGRSDWQSPAFAALAPLALLRPGSRRLAGLLGGYVAYLFLTWWLLTHRLDRFWLPLLPALAVLAGLGADWVRGRAWAGLLAFVLAISFASDFVHSTTALVAFNEWTGDLAKLRAEVPRLADATLARLDSELPRGARPLLIGQAAVFHFGRPLVYNTVFDRETFEAIDRDRTPDEVRLEFGRRGITHVYVDWFQIDRFRSPGNYGFSSYVTPDRFERLVRAGVLGEPRTLGKGRDLYAVIPPS